MTDETTLSELFARDPMSYTTQDIDTIIERFRKARHQFNNLGDMKAGKVKPAKAVDPQAAAKAADLLSGLGL